MLAFTVRDLFRKMPRLSLSPLPCSQPTNCLPLPPHSDSSEEVAFLLELKLTLNKTVY